jgi:hypothetical protein
MVKQKERNGRNTRSEKVWQAWRRPWQADGKRIESTFGENKLDLLTTKVGSNGQADGKEWEKYKIGEGYPDKMYDKPTGWEVRIVIDGLAMMVVENQDETVAR